MAPQLCLCLFALQRACRERFTNNACPAVLQNPNCTFFYVDNIVHRSNADWLRLGLGQRRAQERSAGMEEVQKTKQSNVGNLKK